VRLGSGARALSGRGTPSMARSLRGYYLRSWRYQRGLIRQAFGCPVRETYGMAEIMAAASECACEMMHLWPEAGLVEILGNAGPAPRGECGQLVCTGLLNADMPLIRYRVGDVAALSRDENGCSRDRRLPHLARIEGRADGVS